jgi:hypothetical protein
MSVREDTPKPRNYEPMVPARLLEDARLSIKTLMEQNAQLWAEVDRLSERRPMVRLKRRLTTIHRAAGVMVVIRGHVLVIGWRPDFLSEDATAKLNAITSRQSLNRGQYLSWVLTGKEPPQ